MSETPVYTIQIVKNVPFTGSGDSLESRLRNVALRGFPDIKIYEKANFSIQKYGPQAIASELYSPQLHIYTDRLDKVDKLAALFKNEGTDIYHLDQAYDYIAVDESGETTEWTMLPPIVERFDVPLNNDGTLNYGPLISPRLQQLMDNNDWGINPDIQKFHYQTGSFKLINDGAHRVQAGLEYGGGISVLEVTGITPGFPYYAIPQSYSVKEFSDRNDAEELKVHVLTSPGHKQLYRLFPSGGIKSGVVRPPKEGEVIV